MAARPLQPSEYEIQREVEALKDLRRRSTNPGALTIDPDLPIASGPGSPTSQYRQFNLSPTAIEEEANDALGRAGGLSGSKADLNSDEGQDSNDNPTDDPFHLFWVPASKHPELAPAEFRAFLKEHSRVPPTNDEGQPLSRSPSLSSSSSLSRKKSMLSRPYKPREGDGIEEEKIVPLQRNHSFYRNEGPHLTISDLQKLEELAEEASQSDDPSKLRSVLRRSLSLNMSPTAILMDEIPEMGDEADAPIIIPSRDKALRRTARTKIRKPGLPGDGGGHRFASSRRQKTPQLAAEPRTSSDLSASDHGEVDPSPNIGRRSGFSDEGSQRPDSYSEETSIFDAYAGEEDDEQTFQPNLTSPQPLEPFTIPSDSPAKESLPPSVSLQPERPTIIHQPQPQRLAVPQPPSDQSPSRTPSPSSETHTDRPSSAPVQSSSIPPAFVPISTPPPSKKDKEKDKKGLFKWGSGKNKEPKNENQSRSEKESGFLFNLFGGKKKQDAEFQSSITGGASGREAAQALLGASKSSKAYVPPTSPGLAPGVGGNPYARYPIHVERAIYRLSHIKLANPRRPLYEQVLISNLMFWYLGIINKAQNPSPTGANGSAETQDSEKEEREKREREEKEKAEKERLEKDRLEKEQRERELEMKKKESNKRGSLTKPAPGGPAGGRRAEVPVRGPQYEMQHRVIEQEYGGYGIPPRSPTNPNSPPPANGGLPNGQYQQRPPQPMPGQPMPPVPHMQPPPPGARHMPGPGQHMNPGQQMPVGPGQHMPIHGQPMQQLPQQQLNQYYYQQPPPAPDGYGGPQRAGLPPGAMSPVDPQQQWLPQPLSPQRRNPSPNPPDRRSQSPPSQGLYGQPPQQQTPLQQLGRLNTSQESLGDRNGGYRSPGRSLSATASSPPSQQPNGVLRKGNSAHATVNYIQRPRTSEGRSPSEQEEDLPLAMWQQQRRK